MIFCALLLVSSKATAVALAFAFIIYGQPTKATLAMKLFGLSGGWLFVGLCASITILLAVEAVLRVGFGFGNPPLYIADKNIGYLLAPNQQVKRFGNRIRINDYSMRAEAIAPLPEPDTLRVFLLGDSLANGNWWTDQSDILSARIVYHLQGWLPEGYSHIEAMNASANSWGPRNELAYLERFGTFGATVLVLLLNTDDLFGVQPTSLPVGRDRSYPSRKPPLAILEVINRLRSPKPIPGLKQIQEEGGDRVGKNITAIEGIHQKVSDEGGQLIVVLSPLKRELPGPKDYELVARQRLHDWAIETDVPYLDLLESYRRQPEPESLYRDHIHLSPAGNELVGDAISRLIKQHLTQQAVTD